MAVEFRRGDSVRFAFSTEGMDPEAIKREIYATMKLSIAAGTTPYIDDQPFDMTLYHLELRIDAEAAQRKADIVASEQRLLTIVEAKLAEVVAKVEELSNYTRETFRVVGATQQQMRHELKATIQKVKETPEIVAELIRGVLNMARSEQDKKKEKHDGN